MSNFSELSLNPLKEKKLKKCIFNNILLKIKNCSTKHLRYFKSKQFFLLCLEILGLSIMNKKLTNVIFRPIFMKPKMNGCSKPKTLF